MLFFFSIQFIFHFVHIATDKHTKYLCKQKLNRFFNQTTHIQTHTWVWLFILEVNFSLVLFCLGCQNNDNPHLFLFCQLNKYNLDRNNTAVIYLFRFVFRFSPSFLLQNTWFEIRLRNSSELFFFLCYKLKMWDILSHQLTNNSFNIISDRGFAIFKE